MEKGSFFCYMRKCQGLFKNPGRTLIFLLNYYINIILFYFKLEFSIIDLILSIINQFQRMSAIIALGPSDDVEIKEEKI